MKTSYVTSAARADQLPNSHLGEFAFVGKSNVGKSTLINAILGHTGLARTSRTPGRTQMANFFLVNDVWHFVDLPGYGFSKNANRDHDEWQNLMDAYLRRSQIVRTLFLWDPRRTLEPMDYRLLLSLGEHRPVIFVLTKCDKLNRVELDKAQTFFTAALKSRGITLDQVIATSTLKQMGIDQLRTHLLSLPAEFPR